MNDNTQDKDVSTPIPTQQESLLEYSFLPRPEAVPGARRAVTRVCQEQSLNDDTCAELDLALGEALANAVVHGGKHAPERPVGLSLWRYDQALIVKVHDSGPGFEPPKPPYPMPDPEAHATHGRGLPMMQMLTDAMVVCRGDVREGGESIFLVKKI